MSFLQSHNWKVLVENTVSATIEKFLFFIREMIIPQYGINNTRIWCHNLASIEKNINKHKN